eukprot:7376724-Pyramimonas_sp.AAC.1
MRRYKYAKWVRRASVEANANGDDDGYDGVAEGWARLGVVLLRIRVRDGADFGIAAILARPRTACCGTGLAALGVADGVDEIQSSARLVAARLAAVWFAPADAAGTAPVV